MEKDVPLPRLGGTAQALQRATSVRSLELRGRPHGPEVALVIEFNSPAGALLFRPKLQEEAKALGAVLLDLLEPRVDEKALAARIQALEVREPVYGDVAGRLELFQRRCSPGAGATSVAAGSPLVQPAVEWEVPLENEAGLVELWARHVGEGGLLLSDKPGLQRGARAQVHFRLGAEAYTAHGVVTACGAEGARAVLTPAPNLKAFLERAAAERKAGRKVGGSAGAEERQHERFQTALEVSFSEVPALSTEYVTNISRGGMFVKTSNPPPLRERVELTLHLPSGAPLSLTAEVVHVCSVQDAQARGIPPGVGLQFIRGANEAYDAIEALLVEYQKRKPKVLVFDSVASRREQLCAALRAREVETEAPTDGSRALEQLIDQLFEVDALLIDLEMPGLDGRALVDRIRRLGGETDLKLVVLGKPPLPDQVEHALGPDATAQACAAAALHVLGLG